MDESRIPVLVGCGQITQREPDPRVALGPLDLMAQAARLAADDSGAGAKLLAALDTLAVIRLFADTSPRFASPFGSYANPPATLAGRIGAASARRLIYTHPGGNMPQYCVNRLCEAVTRGEVGAALVVGAEALATQKAAQRANIALAWSDNPGGTAEAWGVATRGWSDTEERHGARAAIYTYPLFENAIRGALGRSVAAHQAAMGTLLARFAAVAAANPLADRRAGYSAEQIAQVRPDNPVIGFPYTRLMSANAYIDQGAAVIVTSVALARQLGVPREQWVFLHGCADAHDHWYISHRRDYHSSPAMRRVFAETLNMAGVTLADIGAIDLYSCFASAVEIACQELGLAQDDPRGLTLTGGLPYFGGPGNNYVSHAIAAMMDRVRAAPGTRGLVTANGNYVTKHSAAVYSTEMPQRPFAPLAPATYQAELDQVPHPRFADLADGPARVETYTVMHDRQGPSGAIVVGRLADGSRFLANTPVDAGLLAAMQTEDVLGRAGRVRNDGQRNVFTPG
jgi:acetyl-CoA C-acetyltransferase